MKRAFFVGALIAPSLAGAAPSGPVYWKLTDPLDKVLENQRCFVATPASADAECGYTTCFAGEEPEAFFSVDFRPAGKLEVPTVCDTKYRNATWKLEGATVKVNAEISSGLTIDRTGQIYRQKWEPVEETIPEIIAYGDGRGTVLFSHRAPPNLAPRFCSVFPRLARTFVWYCLPKTAKAEIDELPIVTSTWLDIVDAGGGKPELLKIGAEVAKVLADSLEDASAESMLVLASTEPKPPIEGVEVQYAQPSAEAFADRIAIHIQKKFPRLKVRRRFTASSGSSGGAGVAVWVGRAEPAKK